MIKQDISVAPSVNDCCNSTQGGLSFTASLHCLTENEFNWELTREIRERERERELSYHFISTSFLHFPFSHIGLQRRFRQIRKSNSTRVQARTLYIQYIKHKTSSLAILFKMRWYIVFEDLHQLDDLSC